MIAAVLILVCLALVCFIMAICWAMANVKHHMEYRPN